MRKREKRERNKTVEWLFHDGDESLFSYAKGMDFRNGRNDTYRKRTLENKKGRI